MFLENKEKDQLVVELNAKLNKSDDEKMELVEELKKRDDEKLVLTGNLKRAIDEKHQAVKKSKGKCKLIWS